MIHISKGKPFPLGSSLTSNGVNFSLIATNAEFVEILLFEKEDSISPKSILKLNQNKIKSRNDLNKTDFLMVDFSDKIKNSDNEIRYFLRSKMYNNKNVLNKNNKGKLIIKKLFAKISKNPAKFISKEHLSKNKYRSVSDFISGMTDRYAINLYNDIK